MESTPTTTGSSWSVSAEGARTITPSARKKQKPPARRAMLPSFSSAFMVGLLGRRRRGGRAAQGVAVCGSARGSVRRETQRPPAFARHGEVEREEGEAQVHQRPAERADRPERTERVERLHPRRLA